jgi:hypothetical protein
MQLSPSVDIEVRFREELKSFPHKSILLIGDASLHPVAVRLLRTYAPDIMLSEMGVPVQLMSMEQYCAQFLGAFLEENDPPQEPILLKSIPESEIMAYAKKHDLPFAEQPKDDVRTMLDNLAKRQPQTYFSLYRSAQRLRPAAERLRKSSSK